MKKVLSTIFAAVLITTLSGCAQEPLLAHAALNKLTDAGISCGQPEEIGSLFCKDSDGNPYSVIIWSGETETIQENMAEDLNGMCSSSDPRYSRWAEGANWRSFGTANVSVDDLASALGGSVKEKKDNC